jgi:hypothetical protein
MAQDEGGCRCVTHVGVMPSSHHRRAIVVGLHRLALEGEPGLALFWVVGRRILEATEGLALLQGLRQGPAQV